MTCRPAMNSTLTSLERRCLELVAAERWPSFRIDGIRVTLREDTGVGRFVYFQNLNHQILKDGLYETRASIIEMEGLSLGLDFAVSVVSSRIESLELVTPSPEGWDGIERAWWVTSDDSSG